MIDKSNELRCGVPPVMSQAGGVPGPMPRMGPPKATVGQSSSRHVLVKQRRRNKERAKSTTASPSTRPQQSSLNILQVNISGVAKKKLELAHLFNEKNIHVALVQESQHQNTDPYISGYTHNICDHQRENCQGIITYVRNDLTGTVENIESARPTDIHKITIWYQGSKFMLYNVYNPPWNDISFHPLQDTVYTKTIIAGDFNGHSPQWGYADHNNTGKAIEEFCERTNLSLLQDEDSPPTLLFRVNKKTYRPDLTMVSSDLLNRYTIEVLDDVGSDHRPILTSIHSKKKKVFKRKTKWNFKKANWKLYQEITDHRLTAVIEKDHATIDALCENISTVILDAAVESIPKGCRKHYKPFWSNELQEAENKTERMHGKTWKRTRLMKTKSSTTKNVQK